MVVNLAGGNDFSLSVDQNGDGVNDQTLSPSPTQLAIVEGAPQIITVRQLESAFFDRPGDLRDPATHGLLVGVLFDKPVTEESAESEANYEVEVNRVEDAQLQRSGRLVYLYLQKPIGNLVPRSITVQGVEDARGNALAQLTLPIDMVLTDGAHVFGQVRQADGTPVPGALFSLTVVFGQAGFTVASIHTDAEGGFDLDYVTALGDGIVLFAQDPVSLDTTTLRARIRAPGEMLLLNPTFLGKGVVRGTVFDASGDPVPDILVRVFPTGFNRGIAANANALGEYVVNDVPVGTYSAWARDPTGAFGEAAGVILSAGQTAVTDIELVHQPDQAGRLVGRVFHSDGATPAAGFDVYVGSYDRRTSTIAAVDQTVTNESGSFAFESLLAGGYDVAAVDSATQQLGVAIGVQVIAEITNSTNIVLEALGNVEGVVLDAQGNLVEGALVTGGLELVETDENGHFFVPDVPAGKRVIEAGNPATLRRGSVEIAVLPGQTVTAEIRLEARATILGRVLDAAGNPVPEATVRIPSAEGFTFVFANDGGFFRFPDLHLGEYLIQAPGPAKGEFPSESLPDGTGLIAFMIREGMDPATAFTACDIPPGCHDFPPGGESQPPSAGDLNAALAAYQNAVQTLFSVQDPQLTGVGDVPTGGFGWNKVKLFQDSTTVVADINYLTQGSVSGTTLGSNGDPTSAAVRLLALGLTGTGFPKFKEFARITTDPLLGEFSFSGIPRFDLATFQATGIRSGNFSLEAANPFTSAIVQFSGQLNVNNPNMTGIELQFPPPAETNGDIEGIVFMPDGVTPAPEDTEVAISFGDLVLSADADGKFRTQNQLLPAGPPSRDYRLTATSPDGLRGEAWVKVFPAEVAQAEVRLLGLGDVSVTVVRPNGLPVPNADLTLKRGTFPNDTASAITNGDGEAQFFNITEGLFGVTAVEQGTGLKGAASGTVIKDDLVELTITIKASGTVRGKFVSASGQTPIANAQVALDSAEGIAAFTSTDAGGRFELSAIPVGRFTVEGFDPLTRVSGRANGEVRFEGDLVEVTVIQLPRGTVEGAVLQGDGSTPVPGAPVTISTSGFGATTIQATTRSDGGFRFEGVPAGSFTLRAIDPLSGFNGEAAGSLSVEGEFVQQNVLIEPFGAVHVQVLDSGDTPVDNAEVTLARTGFSRTGTVNTSGEVTFEHVPLGDFTLTARSLANERNAGRTPVSLTEAALTVDATVKLRGIGTVEVTVVAADGVTTVPSARVTLTAQASFGSEQRGVGAGTLPAFFTGASGTVTIPGVPVGDFFVKGESGAVSGLAFGSIASPDQVVAVTVQLGGAGSVVGSVLLPNGLTPAIQAIVTLSFQSQSGLQSGVLQVNTDLSGSFGTATEPEFTGIPIGPFTLSVFEIISQGVQLVQGSIDADGQVVDLGALVLDNTAPFVAQITPADGASGVPVSTDIVIEFNEPIQPNSLFISQPPNLLVKKGSLTVLGSLTFSNNNTTATFTPLDPLESDTLYTVTILGTPKGPKDRAGLELLDPFVASFRTQDIIPPQVDSISPQDGQRQLLLDAVVRVAFTEAMADTFSLTLEDGAGQLVDGQVETALGGTVAIFTPTNFLKANEVYTVTLSGAQDLAGNPLVGGAFASQFFTVDTIPPVINALNLEGTPSLVEGTSITIVPDIPSADVARVEYLIDGATPFVRNAAPFSLDITLPVGKDSILASATAVDFVGNRSQPATELVIPISDNAPPAVTLTNLSGITEVGRGQALSFEATATDDLGLSRIVFSTLGELVQSSVEDAPDDATDFTAAFGFTVPNAARSGKTITVQAVAVDDFGAESAPASLELVILDATPPTVAITSPVNGAQVVPGPLNVTVTASDDVVLDSVTLDCSPSAAGCETRTVTPPAGSTIQMFTVEIPDLDAPATVQFTATATDTRGNVSAQVTRTVQLADDAPPQVTSLTLVGGGTEVDAGEAVTVRAQATDNIGVRRVEFRLEGALTQTTIVNIAPATSATVDFSFSIPTGASEDIIVTATAFDAATPSAPVSLTLDVIADTQPPTVEILQPADGAHIIEGETLTVRASAQDNAAVSRIMLNVGGVLTDSREQVFSPAATPVEAVFQIDVPIGTPLGDLTLEAVAEDTAGNSASDSVTVQVIDGEPPTVEILGPADGADVDPRSPLSVVIHATDNLGVTSITLIVPVTDFFPGFIELRTIAATTDATETFEIAFSPPPVGDTLTLRAIARDGSGNDSGEAVVTVNVLDVVPPQIFTVTPPDGTADVAATITVIAQSPEPLDPATVNGATVTLAPDGGSPVAAQVTLSADGHTITLDPDAELSAATLYRLTLTSAIADLAGNPLDEFTSAFTTSAGQPPFIVSTPVTTARVGQEYAYDVDADDPDFGDALTFSLDLAPAGMVIDANSGLIAWTPTDAQLGANDVTVRVTDAAGLFDTQSFTIEVTAENTPPVANAGDDQEVFVGDIASLNGSASFDPDGDDITPAWTIILRPAGSVATLSDADTFNPFFTPDVAGDYVVQLVVTDSFGASATDTVVVTAIVRNTILLSPSQSLLLTRDTGGISIMLGEPAGAGGVLVNLESDNTAVAQVSASVLVPEGEQFADFEVQTGIVSGLANITASADGFDGDSAQVIVSLRDLFVELESVLVGVGRETQVFIDLGSAPVGGVTVNLEMLDEERATVSPQTLNIPEGETFASAVITGVAFGQASIVASADGYSPASADFIVTNSIITMGASLTIAPNQTLSTPLTLNQPAPSGGLTIELSSSDESVATVTPSVFVPEGATTPTTNPQVGGVNIGSAVITASADGFAPDTLDVTVTLTLSFSPTTLSVVENSAKNITLNLSAPAPQGVGLTVSLSVDDPNVATVADSVFVGEGQTSAVIAVTGVTPNASTTLRASVPGVEEATATISVTPAPPINIGNATVGKDLQTSLTGSLGANAPAGNVQVNITSADPSRLLLSTSASVQGAGSITIQVGAGNTFISTFYLQALADSGSVEITTSAPGYATDTSTITLTPSGFSILTGSFSTTTFAANSNVTVRATSLTPGTLAISSEQDVRGGLSVQIALESLDTSVGTISSPVTINGGQSRGTASFDPIGAGETVLSMTQPAGFSVPSNGAQQITATVSAPDINLSNVSVGRDLQTAMNVFLETAPPVPTDVVLAVADDTIATLTTNATVAGGQTVTFEDVTSTFAGTVIVQGRAEGATTLTAQAVGYDDDASNITVTPSGFHILTGSFSTTTFAANSNVTVRATSLTPGTLAISSEQDVRGGLSMQIELESLDPSVGTITSPVTINGGQSRGTASFDPIGAGETILSMTQPAGFSVPSNGAQQITATVSAPNIVFSSAGVSVGKDLQTSITVRLGDIPPAPVDITLTVADESIATISTSGTLEGGEALTFEDVSNTVARTVIVQGRVRGATTITASAAGYNDGVFNVTVVPSGFHFLTSSFSANTFEANSNVILIARSLNPSTLAVSGEQSVRAGLSVQIELESLDPSVGTISSPVTINGGQSRGTASFDPIGAGETVLSMTQPVGFSVPSNGAQQITATVTAPNINVGVTSVIVGKDLQQGVSVFLQSAPPVPVDITLTVSSTAIATISSNPTLEGSNTITSTGVANTASRTVYVQGRAEGSTTITAQAVGYNDRVVNVTVVPSGFAFLTASFTTGDSSANANVTLRALSLDPTTLNISSEQDVRGGLSVQIALASSDTSVGTITGPVTINGGQSRGTATFDPISGGETVLSMTQPAGFSVPSNGAQQITAVVLGIVVPAGQQNLSLLPGVIPQSSSDFNSSFDAPKGVDGNLSTGWLTANNDPAPSFTVIFPQDVTVHSLQIVPDLSFFSSFIFITGRFRLLDASDAELFDSGTVAFIGGRVNIAVSPAIGGVRKAEFTGILWQSIQPGFGEFGLVGTIP
ncbi:MAG: carboxypeptidase regulatory-like domain-containing protein [Chloroflexi bacterium]|nr:carboxypeptidase regulatory-like domain-containing protein [Chloroflexota bacterium]